MIRPQMRDPKSRTMKETGHVVQGAKARLEAEPWWGDAPSGDGASDMADNGLISISEILGRSYEANSLSHALGLPSQVQLFEERYVSLDP